MASSFAPSSIAKITRSSISSPLSSGASKISGITPKLFVSGMRFRPRTMSSPILSPQSSVTDSSPILSSQSSVTDTLVETNKILVEIQQQIAIAFGMRNAEEREKNENLKEERSRRRLRLREGALESVKKIGGAIKKTAKFVASPFKGFFDKILEFISLLGLGIGANAVFGWFEKEENREKLKKFFKIITSNWKLIRNILGVIGGLIIGGKIIALGSAIAALAGPLAVLAAAVGTVLLAKKGAELSRKLQEKKRLEQEVSLGVKDPSKIGGEGGMTFEEYKIFNFMEPGFEGLQDAKVDPRIEKNKKLRERVFSPDYDPMDDTPQIIQREKTFGERVGDFFRPAQNFIYGEERAMGGPVNEGNTYLVGERGPEIFAPNIDGSIVNNMRTEKIYQMISSKNAGKINFVSMELPPKFMNSGKNTSTEEQQEIPIPTISAVNGSNPYMSITPNVYGIYV